MRMMNKFIASAAFATALVAGAALVSQAGAATMTFEGVVAPGDAIHGTPYTEAGFSLTNSQANSDAIYGALNGGAHTNGTSVFVLCPGCDPSPVIELTAVGGGAFNLIQLDAANSFPFDSPGLNQSVTAIGNFVGGGTITQTLLLTDAWTTFLFSGFTGLASVDFNGITSNTANFPDVGFDNIVAETPIPAALPLFAGGLGVIGLLARRRKQKAVAALAAA